jgi:hypothetical protein
MLVGLTSPEQGFPFRDRIASNHGDVERAVIELARLLKYHGEGILHEDPRVLANLKRLTEDYWTQRHDAQIRQRAEAAMAAKDFQGALKQYQLLGDRRRPLDSKRMDICQRRTI